MTVTFKRVPHSNPGYNFDGTTVTAYAVFGDGKALGVVEGKEVRGRYGNSSVHWTIRGSKWHYKSRKSAVMALRFGLGLTAPLPAPRNVDAESAIDRCSACRGIEAVEIGTPYHEEDVCDCDDPEVL